MKIQHLRAHLALLLVNMFYGANHVIAKGIMPNILTPNVFIFLRVAGATALFWLIRLFSKTREKVDKKDFLRIAACSLFGVAMNQLFFFHGLNLSSSINAGIIMTLNPIMVVILSYFILKETITTFRVAGVVIGATGAVLLTLSSSSENPDLAIGDLFLLINAASYAVYLVLVKPLMAKYRPITVITYVFLFGLVGVTLFPPTLMDLVQTDFSLLTGTALVKVLYVIVGVTFFAYLLTVYGLSKLSPSASSVYIYTQPILVILFAVLFAYIGFTADYTDTITTEKILYMVLIFVGVYITSLKRRRNNLPS